MEKALAEWVLRVDGVTGQGRGRRYPVDAQRSAVALVRRALAGGMRLETACRSLGVPSITLKRWMRGHAALVPVEVVTPVELVRLHVGHGHVDISVAQLAVLLGLR